jgi:hypothetical protein
MAQLAQRQAVGLTAGVRFQAGENFSFLNSVHTVSEAHPASYPIGPGEYFLEGKATGA